MAASTKRYPNVPRVAVGGVVIKDGCVLLVRRRDPPNAMQWAIPGGSVGLGEGLAQAVEREILEETGIEVRAGQPVYVFETVERDELGLVRYHYVIVDLMADYLAGIPRPGDDADDARWVALDGLQALEVNATTMDLLDNTLGIVP